MPQRIVAGIDEVGRGPLAGPVVAACVHIPEQKSLEWLEDVTDSKKISKLKREKLDQLIKNNTIWNIATIPVETIDQINIFQATMRAMEQAAQLSTRVDHLYIDGNKIPPNIPCTAEAIVQGDSKIKEIACASIIAKVYRDHLMLDLHQQYPDYGWDQNAGYGTKKHIEMIEKYGVTPYHRLSFTPVKNYLAKSA